jgi:hypothetical protein
MQLQAARPRSRAPSPDNSTVCVAHRLGGWPAALKQTPTICEHFQLILGNQKAPIGMVAAGATAR